MSLTIYHNPRCSKSRQTLELINASVSDVSIVDYQKSPPSAATIERLAALLNLPVAELVRRGDEAVRQADDLPAADDNAAFARWLAEHPGALQRPIVVDADGERAILGRPPENVIPLLQQ